MVKQHLLFPISFSFISTRISSLIYLLLPFALTVSSTSVAAFPRQFLVAEALSTDSLQPLESSEPKNWENQGKVQFSKGRTEEALRSWQLAVEQYAQAGDDLGLHRNLVYQAIALQDLGLHTEAVKTLIPALVYWQQQEDSEMKATSLRVMADLLLVTGEVKNPQLQEFLAQFRPQQSDEKEENWSHFKQAEALLQESLKISSEGSFSYNQSLLSLGNTARAAYSHWQDNYQRVPTPKDLEKANAKFNKAVDYYQQATNSSDLTLNYKATLNHFNLLIDAQKWLQEIEKEDNLNRRTRKVKQQFSQEVEPQLQQMSTDLPKIIAGIERLETGRDSLYVQLNLANSLMELPDGKEYISNALNLLTKAVEIARNLGDSRSEAFALQYLGKLYASNGQLAEAQQLTQQAFQLVENKQAEQEIYGADLSYQTQWQLGKVLLEQVEQESAIAAYENAIESLDKVRKDLLYLNNTDLRFSFRDDVEPVYRELADLLLQAAKQEEDNPDSTARQTYLKKAVAVMEQLQLAELEDYLRCQLQNGDHVSIQEVVDKDNLPVAVIYPIIFADRLEIIVKLPQESELKTYTTNITAGELENLVEKVQTNIKQKRAANNASSFQDLYRLILKDIDLELQNHSVETLAFVLNGSLRSIPLSTLHDGEKYLIEKYSLASSLGLQIPEDTQTINQDTLLLAAGVSKENLDAPALPYVRDELIEIAKFMSNSKILENEDFTTATLQQQIETKPFSIVHIATHGIFSSRPEETYLMASGEKINLTQFDNLIRNQTEINTTAVELLVLSACETANGDKRAALGMAGVAVQAGARSAVASLYLVNDQSTSILMGKFYQELGPQTPSDERLTKAEALRSAQLSLLDKGGDYSKPYYWSPFILVGNWR
ncbi:MAG: CHAT domain-containing protein [Spirulinaceae cyanobacterium]